MKPIYIIFFAFLLSCNAIETGKTLEKEDIDLIKRLGMLDEGEEIYQFYSEFRKRNAGSFFTNKRIAKYWIDEDNKSRNNLSFALYPDITAIDTVYQAGLTYCPYVLITKADNTTFKVCAGRERTEVKLFFEKAISLWKQHKNDRE